MRSNEWHRCSSYHTQKDCEAASCRSSFAQPEPVAPQLSAAAGYAQEFASLFPSLASLQNSAAGRDHAAQINAGQMQQNQAQFEAQQRQQRAMQESAQSYGAASQNAQLQTQADMPQIRANAAVSEQQQLDQWMQNQAWTAQDDSALAQASNGWSQIQADPSLSQDEKLQAASQYRPYIQQQQQRKEAWAAKTNKQHRQNLIASLKAKTDKDKTPQLLRLIEKLEAEEAKSEQQRQKLVVFWRRIGIDTR